MLVFRDKRYFKQNEAKDRKRIIQHENLAVIVITTLKQGGKNVRDMLKITFRHSSVPQCGRLKSAFSLDSRYS